MKPDSFSCTVTFSKTDLGILPCLRWSSLKQLVIVGFTTNEQSYLHVAAVIRPSLQRKLKFNENGLALKVASDILFCRHAFTFFYNANYFIFH